MKRNKTMNIDGEFLNDMTADQLEDYGEADDIEEEFFRELKKNRYPKGL